MWPSPAVDETYEILKGLKSRFEEHHDLKFTNPALKVAAELAAKHINDRFLPDKAIDVIDEAGAYQRLQPAIKTQKDIGVSDIELVISKIARIPAKSVSSSDKEQLKGLAEKLKMVVFGQDPAIDALSTSIKMARAGCVKGTKPLAASCLPDPQVWVKPKSVVSYPIFSASSWCALICLNIWSATRSLV